ncbi:methyl-accepting chemotaxis protein [Burkholderia glumae]|uniref:methyl-accepting chemotaxis protein n=1 Tax=Burkholderia glumae TaxID=337 RepID=UPI002151638F|nr:methyl-accepting chemotaxis protein [Burkholderia glumae]
MSHKTFRLRTQFMLLILGFSSCFIAYSLCSLFVLKELRVNGPLYQKIQLSNDLVSDILPPPEYVIESYLLCFQLLDADAVQQPRLIDRLASLRKDYDDRYRFWSEQPLNPDTRRALIDASHPPAVAFYRIVFDDFIPAVQREDKVAARDALGRISQQYDLQRKAIDSLVQLATRDTSAVEADAQRGTQSSFWLLAGVFGLALAVSILMTHFMARRLQSQLGGEPALATHVANHIAAGDLTVDIGSAPAVSRSLLAAMQAMQANLTRMVADVRAVTQSVAAAAGEIVGGNSELSTRSGQQAASLEETAASVTQLTETVKQNADNARQANALATQATNMADVGDTAVQRMVGSIEKISGSSNKISEITGVIESIAFQTNILALNAAVEAARAGEQGRGFAVVASEVRSLAQRSAAAAKEIKALIEASVTTIEDGARQANDVGTTVGEVRQAIKRVSDLIGEIAAASDEQSRGIEQVNQAVNQIEDITRRNADLFEQATGSAQSLERQAVRLTTAVSAFKLMA